MKAVPVTAEKVVQHVAFCPSIFVDAATSATAKASLEEERVAEPNEASVTKMSDVPGRTVEPKRTAVPLGEVCVPVIETQPFSTGKEDRNPVLFFVGSPFTVVKSAVSSALKKVCETVFNGPFGGFVWFSAKGRRDPVGRRPVGVML